MAARQAHCPPRPASFSAFGVSLGSSAPLRCLGRKPEREAPVAQLVEHRSTEPKVRGSNPLGCSAQGTDRSVTINSPPPPEGLQTFDLWAMSQALVLAREAMGLGEVPVGAVVVRAGRIVSQAFNLRETLQDPTAHAERIALTLAGTGLGVVAARRAVPCTSHSSPVAMCAGAIVQSPDRPPRLWRPRPQGRGLRVALPDRHRPPTEPPLRGHDGGFARTVECGDVLRRVFPRASSVSAFECHRPRSGGGGRMPEGCLSG